MSDDIDLNKSLSDIFASQDEQDNPVYDFRFQMSQNHLEQEMIELSYLPAIIDQLSATESTVILNQEKASKINPLDMIQSYSSPIPETQESIEIPMQEPIEIPQQEGKKISQQQVHQTEINDQEDFTVLETNELISKYSEQATKIDKLLKEMIMARYFKNFISDLNKNRNFLYSLFLSQYNRRKLS